MKAMQSDIFGTGKAGAQSCAPGRAMNRLAKAAVLLLSLAVLGVWSGNALAVAKFARTAGNWSAAGTWGTSCAAGAPGIPTAADDVTICNGINVTVDGAGTAGSVTIASGITATALTLGAAGTLTVTNASGLSGNVIIDPSTANVTRSLAVGARTLTVTGSVTINGGTTTGGASNIGQLTVTTGTASLGSLVLNAGALVRNQARVTLTTGKVDVTGDVTLTGGTAATNCDALLSVTGASIVGNGINIGGNLNINSTLATSSTVSITVAGGRITVGGNVTNGDTISVAAGIFTANGATFATTNASAVALSHVTSTTVTSGTLAIAGDVTVAGGVVNPSGATMSVTSGVITVGGILGITAGNILNSNATVSVTTGRLTVNGNTTVTGGAAAGRNALLTVTNAPAVAGNGINVGGTLSTVLNGGGVASASVSITAANGVVNANGDFTNNGTFTNNAVAGQLFLGGATSTINGTFTRGTGTVTMDGGPPLAVTQTMSGTALTELPAANGLNNFTINNTTGFGVTLGSTVAVKGTLTLTSGNVTTGANTLITIPNCPASVSPVYPAFSPNSYVIGNLQLAFPNAATTCIYHLGDSIGYAPVTVALTGATAGTLTGRVDSGDHPDTIANISGIDQTKSANRYWTLGTLTDTLAAYTNYAATLQFCAAACTNAERDATATVGNFIVAKKNVGAWIRPTVGARTATTIQVTGITSAQGFGEFAVGEPLAGVYKGVNQLIDLREVY